MQTFLPYVDFSKSAACLDNKRLNKQIVEAMQIHAANDRFDHGIKAGWQSHPAVKMWRGYGAALLNYRNACIVEWHKRGYKSHTAGQITDAINPPWLGDVTFHLTHQSNLLRKLPEHYGKYFNVPADLPYMWPV